MFHIIIRKIYFKISWHICHSRLAIKMSFHFWPPFLLKIMVELWKMVWRHEMWQKILYANLFKSFFSPFFYKVWWVRHALASLKVSLINVLMQLKLRHYEKATQFENISHQFWQNSCFYSVVSKQVGDFFKILWPFQKSWTSHKNYGNFLLLLN